MGSRLFRLVEMEILLNITVLYDCSLQPSLHERKRMRGARLRDGTARKHRSVSEEFAFLHGVLLNSQENAKAKVV